MIYFFVYLHSERKKIIINPHIMKTQTNKTRLMKLSHEIQKATRVTRRKALTSAWAIVQNSNIAIFYLVERYSNKNNPHLNKTKVKNLTLSLVA